MNVSLASFEELVEKLRQHGLGKESDRLKSLLNAAWSSTSEFIGELGLETLRIQRSQSMASLDLQVAIAKCIEETKTIWPEF